MASQTLSAHPAQYECPLVGTSDDHRSPFHLGGFVKMKTNVTRGSHVHSRENYVDLDKKKSVEIVNVSSSKQTGRDE